MRPSQHLRPTEECHHARPGRALEEAEKDTQGIDLVCILAESNEACYDAPSDLQTWQPPTRADVGNDDLGWNEHETV